ncbi:putative 19protein in cobS 5'region [Dirofilaria immitis]
MAKYQRRSGLSDKFLICFSGLEGRTPAANIWAPKFLFCWSEFNSKQFFLENQSEVSEKRYPEDATKGHRTKYQEGIPLARYCSLESHKP